MIEITVFFNKATNTHHFGYISGADEQTVWVSEKYQVERSVRGESLCGNLLHGDYYLYQKGFDDQAWTCQEAIEAGIIFLEKSSTADSNSVKLGIFKDGVGNRHALPVDVYELFRKSVFWKNYHHITVTVRTNLDERTLKTIAKSSADMKRIYAKSGMFDLVKQNWTFGGEVARTDKQASVFNKQLENEARQLKTWSLNMKKMGMLPSAAGVILGKMSEQV